MSWLRDTIAGRTIIVLIFGLGSILAIVQYLYQQGTAREATARDIESVVERLLLVADTVVSLDADRRDEATHRLSGGPLELHWGRERLATAGGSLDAAAQRLGARLIQRAPDLTGRGLVIGTNRTEDASHPTDRSQDDGHTTLIALPLKDGTWLNATLARVQLVRPAAPSLLLSAILGALGVVLISVLMSRWLTRPLDRLAAGARHLFSTPQNDLLPETGPREVRTLARAINDLQQRIRRLVDDRTQMLAAVSHDLRSPLTRLRLRVGALHDMALRRSIEADLDDMEGMIDATLAFLREDTSTEKVEPVDISAILETIAADAVDAGHAITIDVPASIVIFGRHLALKRALTNLVQNALKYGDSAAIAATCDEAQVHIFVRDRGHGIPADMHEAVFAPFYRLETSRSRSTGGHGLGLTVARTIVRSHGGDVTLANLMPRGLEVRVTLPVASQAAAAPLRRFM